MTAVFSRPPEAPSRRAGPDLRRELAHIGGRGTPPAERGARRIRLSRALEYGMVAVNRAKITGAPVPFGGWKQSGPGREDARQGLEAFAELKYLCIDTRA